MNSIQVGDIVWDIGANVGLYTNLFSDLVGEVGKVVAFEPSPKTFKKLLINTQRKNVRCCNMALGASTGELDMLIDSIDDSSPTNRLVVDSCLKFPSKDLSTCETEVIKVTTTSGDLLLTEFEQPTAIKIDVEGFELEVVRGLQKALSSPRCRVVFCEVHFALLEQNGTPDAPILIRNLIQAAGFKEFRWVDSSHFVAKRI
jgi:FkbM family methyltransferase